MKRGKLKPRRNNNKRAPKARSDFERPVLSRSAAWRKKPRIHPSWLKKSDRDTQLGKFFKSSQSYNYFKSVVDNYTEFPTVENYLAVRRNFPNVELDAAIFGGLETLFQLDSELQKLAIDTKLVAGVLDAYEPDVDELSLRLMECIVAREKIPKSGQGHIDRRRGAISDALVDYLIVIMLESMEWNKRNNVGIPSSLIVLVRDRLCGPSPDLEKSARAREQRENAAFRAAQHFDSNEEISSRKLATLVGVSWSTAARWLADRDFLQLIEEDRRYVASEGFPQKVADFIRLRSKTL